MRIKDLFETDDDEHLNKMLAKHHTPPENKHVEAIERALKAATREGEVTITSKTMGDGHVRFQVVFDNDEAMRRFNGAFGNPMDMKLKRTSDLVFVIASLLPSEESSYELKRKISHLKMPNLRVNYKVTYRPHP